MPNKKEPFGRNIQGTFEGAGKRFALVVTRFNEYVTKQLLEGCLDMLARHGVEADSIDVVWVPGSFEIPTVARKIAEKGEADAVICLGCIISGDTPHFEYIARAAAGGIAEIGQQTGVPAIFGVLTCETIEQAVERAGTKMGNKGAQAALTALEMANLMGRL